MSNRNVIAVSTTLCVAAAVAVARMYWQGPAGASAATGHHTGLAAQHRGQGGEGPGPFSHPFPSKPSTLANGTDTGGAAADPFAAPSSPPSSQPSTQAASQPTTQGDDVPKTFWTQDRMTGDWGGVRTRLEDRGVHVDGSLTLSADKTLSGGTSTAGNAESYKLSIGVTTDLEKLANIKGGSAYLNFRAMDGKKNTLDGAFQTSDQAYLPRRLQISELWYQQSLFDGRLRLKAGKIDANTEFAFVSNASEFVNSSMSFSPTILYFPTDPDPSTGIVGFIYPNEHLYAGVGMFDGSLFDGVTTGNRGPATLFEHSLFFIGEVGAKWTTTAHQDGRVGLGAWGHTGQFVRYDGGQNNSTSGLYLVADQMFWHSHPETDGDAQGIAGFFQYGYTDPSVSAAEHHLGAGLTYTGLIPNRPCDIIGLGSTWVAFTHAAGAGFDGSGELDVEAFYKLSLTAWFSIKPDLQFIHNAGGIAGQPDTVVGSVQATLTF